MTDTTRRDRRLDEHGGFVCEVPGWDLERVIEHPKMLSVWFRSRTTDSFVFAVTFNRCLLEYSWTGDRAVVQITMLTGLPAVERFNDAERLFAEAIRYVEANP